MVNDGIILLLGIALSEHSYAICFTLLQHIPCFVNSFIVYILYKAWTHHTPYGKQAGRNVSTSLAYMPLPLQYRLLRAEYAGYQNMCQQAGTCTVKVT